MKRKQAKPVKFPPYDLLSAREFMVVGFLNRHRGSWTGEHIRKSVDWPNGKAWLTQFYRHMTELERKKYVRKHPGASVAEGNRYEVTPKGLNTLQFTEEFYA